uniref:Ig-like domain-containing protein n=1 Tax=Acetatifactor sp. TaxID=1872090 RepID=UPI0040565886
MEKSKKLFMKITATCLAVILAVATPLGSLNAMDVEAASKVSSVKIVKPDTKVLVLKKGKTYKLKTKVKAKGAKNKKVVYSTSNKKVVTVSA